jgi:hypothetical protein
MSRQRIYEDPIVATIKKHGIPVTRENYIELVHNDEEGEWTGEHEHTLPERLQDYSKVKP